MLLYVFSLHVKRKGTYFLNNLIFRCNILTYMINYIQQYLIFME